MATSAAEPARSDVAPVLGPIVVIGRPRSGSRLVARLLMDAGVFMGHRLSPESLDPLDLAYGMVAPVLCSPGFDACLGDFPRPLRGTRCRSPGCPGRAPPRPAAAESGVGVEVLRDSLDGPLGQAAFSLGPVRARPPGREGRVLLGRRMVPAGRPSTAWVAGADR